MEDLERILDVLVAVVYVGVGVRAIVLWRSHGGSSAAWLAATFGVMSLVLFVGRFVPEHSDDPIVEWIRKIDIAIIVLFPYFLYRFMGTLMPRVRWRRVAASVLTAGLVVGALLLPEIPEQGEDWTGAFTVYVYALLFQWVALSVLVAVRLWRGGRGQPTIARRRMRTMSLASAGLALALVAAGAAGSSEGEEVRADEIGIGVQLLALGSGPLFLLGFAPPGIVRAWWRRPEEQALREAELGLTSAMTPGEIADVLLPHATRLVGGRGSALLGPKGEIVGRHGIDEEAAAALPSERTPSEGTSGSDAVLSVPLRNGSLTVTASAFTPFFGKEEFEILETLAVHADLALDRARLFRELASSNAELEQFAYVTSHDLQEPLRTVASYAELLAERYQRQLDERADRYVNYVVEGCTRMQDLINDLLAFSRVSTKRNPFGDVDADVPLETALTSLNAAINEAEAHITHDDLPVVRGDDSQLALLFQNLIGNSIKFRAEVPPEIHVGVEANGTDWVFSVVDNGIGIDPRYAERIFTIFQRLHTRDDYPGTGIGLSICKKIVERHGGRIWVDPSVDRGTTFRFTIPAAGVVEVGEI